MAATKDSYTQLIVWAVAEARRRRMETRFGPASVSGGNPLGETAPGHVAAQTTREVPIRPQWDTRPRTTGR